MKKKKMLEAFSDIDERYIEEASPENAKEIFEEVRKEKRKKNKWIRYGLLVSACALFIALNLWLFIPYKVNPPSVAEYSSSQYYSVIQKINLANYKKPKYKNNFSKLINGGFFPFKAMDGGNAMPEASQYVETTDNQVEGIIEADIIKRTTTHAFYLNQDKVNVYSLNKEDSKLIASYKIAFDLVYVYVDPYGEMFLSEDGKRLTVISSYVIRQNGKRCFDVVSLNVEDPQNISEIGRITLDSSYKTSRLTNGELLIISDYVVNKNIDFSLQENFIPSIKINDSQIFVDQENIVAPDVLTSATYTVVCKIDEDTLEIEDFTAFLSYTQAVYVSNDYVYVGRAFTEDYVIDKNESLNISKTEIIPISYKGEGLEIKNSVVVEGSINDQYSLDEYEGRLRVVTTTSERKVKGDVYNYTSSIRATDTNASLYVVDLSSMQIVASVLKFAPVGESVKSTRFDKANVYVCTSIQVTDPVFFFDLTNLEDIKIKDTGTIAGFSTSLVNFGDGYLLGIGVGEIGDLKIEIYAEGESDVVSVCKYEEDVGYSQNYKSYYVNRELGLVGLGVWKRPSGDKSYLLLSFDGDKLTPVLKTSVNTDSYFVRMVLIDGYAYIFGQDEFAVKKI